MMDTQEESKPKPELAEDKENIFSQPWKDSDVVLAVGEKELHVHRFILSFQSPVFKAMFNGNFKEARQDRIELKDENYETMLQFLQLLYPANTLHNYAKVNINDENILQILEVADKYAAKDVIIQCTKETGSLKPENAMRLLPYAVRYELPREEIFDVINRHVSTEKLENFVPELSNDPVSIQALVMKCRTLEDATKRANTMLINLLKKYVEMAKSRDGSSKTPVKCVQHEILAAEDFKKAKECENCLTVYKMYLIEKYVFPVSIFGDRSRENTATPASNELTSLLKLTDDIATSLES